MGITIIYRKAVISIINFIEDIYTDYICYKCFYENNVVPDLKIRERNGVERKVG